MKPDVSQRLPNSTVSSLLTEVRRIDRRLHSLTLALATLRLESATGTPRQSVAHIEKELHFLTATNATREVLASLDVRHKRVLVVGRGEPDLLDMYDLTVHPFPQNMKGGPLGYNPKSARAAVAHLEAVRSRGYDLLVFPPTALWWLEHHPALRAHLDERYARLETPGDVVVYDIAAVSLRPWIRLRELVEEIAGLLRRSPSVLDLSAQNLSALLADQAVFVPPQAPTSGELPYLDGGADIVVLDSSDRPLRSEAQRVAATAVVAMSASGDLEILWRIEASQGHQDAELVVLPGEGDRPLPGAKHIVDAVAHRSRNPVLVLAEPGALPLPGCTASLGRTLLHQPGVAAAVGQVLAFDGRIVETGIEIEAGVVHRLHNDLWDLDLPELSFVRTVDGCSAGLLAVDRKAFLRSGGLPDGASTWPELFLRLCDGIRQQDGQILYQPESAVVLDTLSPPAAATWPTLSPLH